MKYLWVHKKSPDENVLTIIDDPIELFKTGKYNEKFDTIYQIGSEVTFKLSLEIIPGTRTKSAIDFGRKTAEHE